MASSIFIARFGIYIYAHLWQNVSGGEYHDANRTVVVRQSIEDVRKNILINIYIWELCVNFRDIQKNERAARIILGRPFLYFNV